jgi:hypothetical protein
MFVGWDWASTTHDVTVLDDAGAVVDRWAFRHTEQDLAAALDRLAGVSKPAALPVIIERTSGLVVDRLVAAGHPVVPVHPTAFWAARPRWGASGAKSDAGDSYKLADYLRTDGHRLRRLDRSDPGLQELQALVRCARTTCGPALLPATSSALCWRRTGPDPRRCSTGWHRRSRSPSWLTTRPPRPPPASARPAWLTSADDTATAAASHQQSCWPGCARPDRPGRHPAGHPGGPCPRPSPAATHPAGDHRRA